ncbi:MAG: Omp28 family outer membrane lipoprotein [Bacteroidaceae bacterium]|nr:Omp28 family outer membrane lipoprotein [Bacteroidaceae bacterium]
MKNYLCLLLAALSFAACDQIAEADRYIEVDAVEQNRNVLLEEFTGQMCVNCPDAHKTVEALKEQYGDALISVSIHAGSFAIEEGKLGDKFQTFKTPEGDQYAALHGVDTYPAGVIDRVSGVQLHTSWASAILSELQRKTTTALKADAALDGQQITVTTNVVAQGLTDAKLQLWLVEDSIVSYQINGEPSPTAYVHNHVYRASINGVGGEALTSANTYQHTIDLRDYWNPQYLSVVAFVYDKDGVQQVVETKVK